MFSNPTVTDVEVNRSGGCSGARAQSHKCTLGISPHGNGHHHTLRDTLRTSPHTEGHRLTLRDTLSTSSHTEGHRLTLRDTLSTSSHTKEHTQYITTH